MAENEKVFISGMDFIVTHNPSDAYRVDKGSILLYVVPWSKGTAGRKLLLSEVSEGSVIPSFSYEDRDYKEWRFLLTAKETAEINLMRDSCTSVLKKRFINNLGIESFNTEGFEDCLVDYYNCELLKDDVFIERGKKLSGQASEESFGVIKKSFKSQEDISTSDDPAYRAVDYVCKYFSKQPQDYEKVKACCGKKADISSIAQACGLISRQVVLDAKWYREDNGVIIGISDKKYVVCVPCGISRYKAYYPDTGRIEKLTSNIAANIDPRAFSICRALPSKALSTKDLIKFGGRGLRKSDIFMLLVLGLICTLIGVLLPTLNQQIYDNYIPLGDIGQLSQICVVIGSFMIGNLFFSIVKGLVEFRGQSRVCYDIQNAVYDRIFRLPESFFRSIDSADFAQRATLLSGIVTQFASTILVTGFSILFSLIYLIRMLTYSGALTGISAVMILVYAAALAFINRYTNKYEKISASERGNASSHLYQYLNGIEKIRMAGAENYAIHEYLKPFAATQSSDIKKNRIFQIGSSLSGISMSLFSMVLYYIMVKKDLNITMGAFIGFNTALGCFSSSIMQAVDAAVQIYRQKPAYDRFKPVLRTPPENQDDNELPGKLSGNIDIEHVTFSYGDNSPTVLKDLSLKIRAGEYVGIVGSSGCGKSTLLKLLLGFETPMTGSIRFDGKSVSSMDKHAFRQNLGVVLQNGKLIAGSIYENITITAPEASMKDVERVIEAVGLKEDIRQMPMGIHTVLSENSGTISGGQQQRILIARAIIRNPSIILFDEATSALDNVTQAKVCKSLDGMNATRIVIAHRLSTIKDCDRIIVLDGGEVAEEGNYNELMKKRGLFYQLAVRQIAE